MGGVKIRQAVILAGGKGTRLRPLTFTTPKPMIPIHGKPFLEYLVELLKKNGIEEIIILVGYLHEKIENYFGDGKKFGLKIKYSYSPIEADTGSRVRNALGLFDKKILLLYSDNYWPLDLESLIEFYEKMDVLALVTVYSNHDQSTKNNMLVNKRGLVEVYDRTRKKEGLNGVDIGFFILDKSVFNQLPQDNFSFEDVVTPKLIKKRQLAGFLTHHKYYGLSNLERIPIIKEYFKEKKVVFLDRDGVINQKPAKAQYVTRWEDFKFLPKAKEALQLLQKKGYTIFIVSNQAGIARGIVTKEGVDKINNQLLRKLAKLGVVIRGIYICPHGWDEGCFCRKPNPGLFFKAAAEYHINLFDSYCLGDDPRDIIAGRAASCKTIFIGKKVKDFKKSERPDMACSNLYEAAEKLVREEI